LRIQPRGRLVQEQEELRLRGQLDGDSQPLPMLDTQRTNDRVRIPLQPAHQQTLLDVRFLLGHRNVLGLTKDRREQDRFANGRSALVRVHLLAVPGLGLEVRREGLAVHEPIAGNDTDARALGEDVQQRGLFFSWSARSDYQ
jgi:hypothetical protein